MSVRYAWPLVLLLCLGATECRLDDDLGEERDVVFETLEYENGADVKDTNSSIQGKRLLVIRDADEFSEFWTDHTATMAPIPAEPDVDFGISMVIAAFAGERETGGYSITVEEIRENDEFMIVEVEIETPGDNCPTTQALTQPHHVVVLDDSDKPVQFSETTVEAPACPT